MATDVEIRLIANNQSAVKGVRELSDETEKLSKAEKKQNTQRKGYIEEARESLDKYRRARDKAFDWKDIETYNKKIKETELRIKEAEEAGTKFEKKTETLNQTIAKWALTLGGATAALKLIKDAIIATTTGLNAFNTAGAVAKQVMYNLVTGATSLTNGLTQVIKAQKELNALRLQEKLDNFEAAKYMVLYKKLAVEANDHTKTAAERIAIYDKSIKALNKSMDIEIETTRKRISAIKDMLKVQPDNEKLKMEYADLNIKLLNIEYERQTKLKEMSGIRSRLVQKEIEDELKWRTDLHNNLSKLIDDYLAEQEKAKNKRLDQIEAEKKAMQQLKNEMADLVFGIKTSDLYSGKDILSRALEPEAQANVPDFMKLRFNKAIWELNKQIIEDGVEQAKEAEDKDLENKEKRVEAIKKLITELADIASEIVDRSVEDAERQRELLDTQVAEAQRSLDTEVELYKAGYASNVSAKEAEVKRLKELRDQAIADEEKARERQRKIDTASQLTSLITASAETIKAFPGPLLPIAIAIIAAMFGAFAAAKASARNAVKLAGGGHGTVKGQLHSEGGEPFLSQVEVEDGEGWGVLSRGATRKYGKVFARMVDSFNKDKLQIPKSPGVKNDIRLDTSMTNSRLDILTGEVRKLNQYFEGQETTSDNGNTMISRKGQTVRVIKRR